MASSVADRSSHSSDAELAAVQRALTLTLKRAAVAYAVPAGWETRIRAALRAILELFDERPDLARLCLVDPTSAPQAASAVREEALATLARRIDDGRRSARRPPPPHAAQAVVAGAIGAIRARMLEPDATLVGDLLDPLTSLIVLPYRGAAVARSERDAR